MVVGEISPRCKWRLVTEKRGSSRGVLRRVLGAGGLVSSPGSDHLGGPRVRQAADANRWSHVFVEREIRRVLT